MPTTGAQQQATLESRNYTLALSSIVRFSTAPVYILLSKVKVTFSQEEIVQDQSRELT